MTRDLSPAASMLLIKHQQLYIFLSCPLLFLDVGVDLQLKQLTHMKTSYHVIFKLKLGCKLQLL